ncbi:MAG TPA: hypothetical protein VLI92_03745 [Candidatus Saccharimonadales bacterium]|nr:hypothetical protein [Candidatus Saccharimonadales bacterium]
MTDQRGNIRILLILLVVVAVVAAGVWFWKYKLSNVPTLSQAPTTSANQESVFPSSPDKVEDVKTQQDLTTLNSSLDSADLNTIDTTLQQNSSDASTF